MACDPKLFFALGHFLLEGFTLQAVKSRFGHRAAPPAFRWVVVYRCRFARAFGHRAASAKPSKRPIPSKIHNGGLVCCSICSIWCSIWLLLALVAPFLAGLADEGDVDTIRALYQPLLEWCGSNAQQQLGINCTVSAGLSWNQSEYKVRQNSRCCGPLSLENAHFFKLSRSPSVLCLGP